MKRMSLVALALLLSVGTSAATTQKWTLGWDNFSEPLNLINSSITWSVSSVSSMSFLTVTFKLVGATPTKLYQVSVNFFCSTFPATFGQFPNEGGGGACQSLTRQGVTKDSAEVELGAILTDIHGNGTFTVVVGVCSTLSDHAIGDVRQLMHRQPNCGERQSRCCPSQIPENKKEESSQW